MQLHRSTVCRNRVSGRPVVDPRHVHRCRIHVPRASEAVPVLAEPGCSSEAERQQVSSSPRSWSWRGPAGHQHQIHYELHGVGPTPVVLIHGFGACHDHWHKLLPELDEQQYSVFVIDLLGFGDSDKPLPQVEVGPHNHLYSYDTWSQQTRDFVNEVVRAPAVLVGNSAGALAALQVAVAAPHLVRGLLLLDCTMRRNHQRNQHPLLHPLVASCQWLLAETPLGPWLVQQVLQRPGQLEAILASAYGDPSCLSPQLVASFRRHLACRESCAVLLDVFTNSSGPLPQDLLPLNTVPTLVVWGGSDPWEPADKAEQVFSGWVADFIVLPGVGHFPMDEVPSLISRLLECFLEECATEWLPAVEGAGGEEGGGPGGKGRPGCEGLVEGWTLRGLMAAAELDAKV